MCFFLKNISHSWENMGLCMKMVYRAAVGVRNEKQICLTSINKQQSKHTHTLTNTLTHTQKEGNHKGSRGFYYKTLWLHSRADAIIRPSLFLILFYIRKHKLPFQISLQRVSIFNVKCVFFKTFLCFRPTMQMCNCFSVERQKT